MKHAKIFTALFFSIMISASQPLYAMEMEQTTVQGEGDCEEESFASLQNLPQELVKIILDKLTVDITAEVPRFFFSESDGEVAKRARRDLYCIRRILPLNGVCRYLRAITRSRIRMYFLEADTYINQLGGADTLLSRAVMSHNSAIAELCLLVGADIDATGHTANNVVVQQYKGAETLLTDSVKQNQDSRVRLLLRLGANPMQVNKHGEVPIDIAHARGFERLAVFLKENGGDPNNRYKYWSSRSVSAGYGYGRMPHKPHPNPSNPFMSEERQELGEGIDHDASVADKAIRKYPFVSLSRCRTGVVFSAGVLVGGIGYWAYKKWKQRREEQKKRRQKLWDEYYRQRIAY